MTFSELPLGTPALFKHAKSGWSSVFEITKLRYSANGKAVQIRHAGPAASAFTCWRDADDGDDKLEFLDTINPEGTAP